MSIYSSVLLKDEMRLLKLDPASGTDNDDIIKRNTSPAYRALSYVWGNPGAKRTILCNGIPLEIGENLFQALRQLREDDHNELLWADALCINQNDVADKSAQVRIMDKIYKNAKLVIAWLGPVEDFTPKALKLIHTICKKLDVPRYQGNQTDSSTVEELGLPKAHDLPWENLARFLHNPYFSRAWIFQEMVLTKTGLLQSGQYVLDFGVLSMFTRCLAKFPNINSTIIQHSIDVINYGPSQSTQNMLSLVPVNSNDHVDKSYSQPYLDRVFKLRKAINEIGSVPIRELLDMTSRLNATNPHDKIFALCSLATEFRDQAARDLFIDYGKPLSEVQTELVNLFLQDSSGSALAFCSHVDCSLHSEDLPSWVPDWPRRRFESLASMYYKEKHVSGISARHEVVARRILQLRVEFLDYIAHTGDESPSLDYALRHSNNKTLLAEIPDLKKWLDECLDLVYRHTLNRRLLRPHKNWEEAGFAFCDVLTMGREDKSAKGHSEMQFHYQNWVDMLELGLQLTKTAEPERKIIENGKGFLEQVRRWGPSRSWLSFKIGFKYGNVRKLVQNGIRFESYFTHFIANRKFCTTKDQNMAWIPLEAKEGDIFCRFKGYPPRLLFGNVMG